ncbi:KpsF/GutQ family sugar-phosphate isomerase [Cohaesibacter celericrescens]|uniref:KpsF/GutQ family sugar-phosphate isomerase n=1 Tax=Cohaesibacter celericrescens TaxID=2067669 RepID=A0A2N5XL71_9HYPH|nr:KpsF/GutQ family sugar-phosphate isomerase [Cohaesibacter celericrescens]PLW75259.1 KpsF/GutQ family sugar-phosphate isomerase [Cohaesibacter celericrescens]
MSTQLDCEVISPIQSAHYTIDNEISGLQALKLALDGSLKEPFEKAVATIIGAKGRLIVTGMGKSGHIARKLAATLASTGTPAFFVHPGEASHGDLGMIRDVDVVLAMSWSGETAELASIISYTRRFKVPLIAMTSKETSTLAEQSDIALCMPKIKEACPHGLAPTTSTTVQLCLGDALAVALLESRGFTPTDFKVFHPGGSLGANLQYVRDLMHKGDQMPLTGIDTRMSEVILIMSQKGFGCVGITDSDGKLVGMVTDGDLRRHLSDDLLTKSVRGVMTEGPKTLSPDTLVPAAIETMNSSSITAIFVIQDHMPVGLLHMHDILRIGAA